MPHKKNAIKPLTNLDITLLVKKINLKHFRGVFMKDELPVYSEINECGIVNLESNYENGSD